MNPENAAEARKRRARAIANAGGVRQAAAKGALQERVDLTVSEAVVLGLLLQDVKTFFCVFGHGSTDFGEALRTYEEEGLARVCAVRNEVEAAHAAMALGWVAGEKAAVVTSIGPGALQAMAGSLAAASDGVGVWHIYGDETTQDEGPNMQQIPKSEQNLFLKLCSTMGDAYCLHTPEAVGTALRRGLVRTSKPSRAGPFYLLLPMNVQPAKLEGFNLNELPEGQPPALPPAYGTELYERAAELLLEAKRVVVKVGGGARGAGAEIAELLKLADGVAVLSPIATGAVPASDPRCMFVGGSKGSICGNFAMEEADLLVSLGSRFVCQSDSSRTGYPKVRNVININADLHAVMHYDRTLALQGDVALTLRALNAALKKKRNGAKEDRASDWLAACTAKREEWKQFKELRYETPTLFDEMWGEEVLTQPAAIKAASDWAKENGAVSFFDAGDVQANGFQVVEDEAPGRTFTETGASYMGFAVSALLATGLASKPFYGLAFTGDGSFMMNPQILIDGVAHGARGCILLLDNRRMAAISGLQNAQCNEEFATWDHVPVDYVQLASSVKGVAAFDGGGAMESLKDALNRAKEHEGLSLIHTPVYYGPAELGGLGAFGRWNVGNWAPDVQAMRHEIGL